MIDHKKLLESEGFDVMEYKRIYNKGQRNEKRSSAPLFRISKGDFSVKGLNSSGLKHYSEMYLLGKNS